MNANYFNNTTMTAPQPNYSLYGNQNNALQNFYQMFSPASIDLLYGNNTNYQNQQQVFKPTESNDKMQVPFNTLSMTMDQKRLERYYNLSDTNKSLSFGRDQIKNSYESLVSNHSNEDIFSQDYPYGTFGQTENFNQGINYNYPYPQYQWFPEQPQQSNVFLQNKENCINNQLYNKSEIYQSSLWPNDYQENMDLRYNKSNVNLNEVVNVNEQKNIWRPHVNNIMPYEEISKLACKEQDLNSQFNEKKLYSDMKNISSSNQFQKPDFININKNKNSNVQTRNALFNRIQTNEYYKNAKDDIKPKLKGMLELYSKYDTTDFSNTEKNDLDNLISKLQNILTKRTYSENQKNEYNKNYQVAKHSKDNASTKLQKLSLKNKEKYFNNSTFKKELPEVDLDKVIHIAEPDVEEFSYSADLEKLLDDDITPTQQLWNEAGGNLKKLSKYIYGTEINWEMMNPEAGDIPSSIKYLYNQLNLEETEEVSVGPIPEPVKLSLGDVANFVYMCIYWTDTRWHCSPIRVCLLSDGKYQMFNYRYMNLSINSTL